MLACKTLVCIEKEREEVLYIIGQSEKMRGYKDYWIIGMYVILK